MTYIKTPVKGMRDFLPKEMELREYVLNVMKETYENFGFELIGTPTVEHIENLSNNQGGENEKLIFKILKRGEKLENANLADLTTLVDSGLRYDLTVPLARMYANNMQNLNYPFRAFQIGYSYRAERPQKGRYRELMQCDLDILGEKTNLAEIEMIIAVVTFLKKLDFKEFKIKINDRRILKAMVDYAEIPSAMIDEVLISLDKFDKIGKEGVEQELKENGLKETSINKYLTKAMENKTDLKTFCQNLPIDQSVVQNLEEIIENVNENVNATIVFDPTLVRGMGYYTGPIFEIMADNFPSAIGGGGRYDEMIAKFSNKEVPACGFSIGFERLILLLEERAYQIAQPKEKICYLLKKETSAEEKAKVINIANKMRQQNKIVKIVVKSKNYKYQKETLTNDNYQIIEEW